MDLESLLVSGVLLFGTMIISSRLITIAQTLQVIAKSLVLIIENQQKGKQDNESVQIHH